MHVLLVSTFFPYPQNCGKACVLGGLCAFFAQHPRVTRLSYFHIAKAPSAEAAALAGDYHHAPAPRFAEACRNLAGPWLAGRRPALQEALTFCRGTQRRLWGYIREQEPDLIVADTIRVAQYLKGAERPPGRYQLYLDDLYSVRYDRILELLERFPGEAQDVLGNFVSFIPARLRGLAGRRGSLKILLGYERDAVRRREDAVVRDFERSFLISPDEVRLLRQRSGTPSVYPMKLLTAEAHDAALCDGRSPYFVFLGDLRLAHNRLAIEALIREGAERLERELPGHRVLIVGKSAPAALVERCARTRNFELTGYVPDLRSLLLQARGMVAPLLFGSGIKIKCLEALRLGVPIVATRVGVEGLGLRPEAEYLHAENISDCVRQMRRLTDDAEHARLVGASHAWFVQNYAPDVVRREYDQLLLAESLDGAFATAGEVAA